MSNMGLNGIPKNFLSIGRFSLAVLLILGNFWDSWGGPKGLHSPLLAPSPPIIEKDKNYNTISHVLGNFSKSEKLILNKIFCQMIESLQKLNDHNENSIICELNSFNINGL